MPKIYILRDNILNYFAGKGIFYIFGQSITWCYLLIIRQLDFFKDTLWLIIGFLHLSLRMCRMFELNLNIVNRKNNYKVETIDSKTN